MIHSAWFLGRRSTYYVHTVIVTKKDDFWTVPWALLASNWLILYFSPRIINKVFSASWGRLGSKVIAKNETKLPRELDEIASL